MLFETNNYDSIISIGSGLSLLTYCIKEKLIERKVDSSILFLDSDLQQGIDQEIADIFSKVLSGVLGNGDFIKNIKTLKGVKFAIDSEIPALKKLNKLPSIDKVIHFVVDMADIKRRGHRFAENVIRNRVVFFLQIVGSTGERLPLQ